MAAPKGNNFWTLRSKHGRDKLFTSPELLMQAAYEYFQHCDKTPWLKIEQLKRPYEASKKQKNGKYKKVLITTAELPSQQPYSLAGFANYIDASESYLRSFEKSLQGKEDPESQDFLRVITRVRQIIETQQFHGAVVGAFNANIIARKLGLVDKKDMTTDGESLNKGYYDFLRQRKTRRGDGPAAD